MAKKLWYGTPLLKDSEPCVRTIVGRAYYAAFLGTRETVRAAYHNPTYDVTHNSLASFMIGSGKTNLRFAGNMLKELKEARVVADYETGSTVTHSFAEDLVDNAAEILALGPKLQDEFADLPVHVMERD